MFYSLLNSSKLKFQRAFLHVFLIISYMITFSGCMTTYNYSEVPDTTNEIASDEITKIELKNGKMIDCKNKLIRFEKGADSVKYIVLRYITHKDLETRKTYWTENRISEKDIYKIYLEVSEVDGTKTTIVILGILVVIALLILIIGSQSSITNLKLQVPR